MLVWAGGHDLMDVLKVHSGPSAGVVWAGAGAGAEAGRPGGGVTRSELGQHGSGLILGPCGSPGKGSSLGRKAAECRMTRRHSFVNLSSLFDR